MKDFIGRGHGNSHPEGGMLHQGAEAGEEEEEQEMAEKQKKKKKEEDGRVALFP